MAPHPTRKKPSRHNNVTHDLPLSFLLSLFPKLFCCSFQKLYKNRHCILCWPLSTQWGIELRRFQFIFRPFYTNKTCPRAEIRFEKPTLRILPPLRQNIPDSIFAIFTTLCVCALLFFHFSQKINKKLCKHKTKNWLSKWALLFGVFLTWHSSWNAPLRQCSVARPTQLLLCLALDRTYIFCFLSCPEFC